MLSEWWAIGLIPSLAVAAAVGAGGLWGAVVAAVPTGFVLHQLARFHLEVVERAFDCQARPALALIQARLGHFLGRASLTPYQVYEVTLYRHPEWQAARDHIHRCWHWVANLRAAAFAAIVAGAVLTAAAITEASVSPGLLFACAFVVGVTALFLWQKAKRTQALLHEFDSAWVRAHWPAYEEVARSIAERFTASGQYEPS
ncbi:MAG: hypothetical protein N3C12_02805 [Candidatus Binatia bacterium]|nr:hypothetical protein [Candidatus Binatia bacterium]